MFNWFKKDGNTEPEVDSKVDEAIDKEKVYAAYKVLADILSKKKATKSELIAAIEEAVGYLGEIAV